MQRVLVFRGDSHRGSRLRYRRILLAGDISPASSRPPPIDLCGAVPPVVLSWAVPVDLVQGAWQGGGDGGGERWGGAGGAGDGAVLGGEES
jgi:hypothetical protein